MGGGICHAVLPHDAIDEVVYRILAQGRNPASVLTVAVKDIRRVVKGGLDIAIEIRVERLELMQYLAFLAFGENRFVLRGLRVHGHDIQILSLQQVIHQPISGDDDFLLDV